MLVNKKSSPPKENWFISQAKEYSKSIWCEEPHQMSGICGGIKSTRGRTDPLGTVYFYEDFPRLSHEETNKKCVIGTCDVELGPSFWLSFRSTHSSIRPLSKSNWKWKCWTLGKCQISILVFTMPENLVILSACFFPSTIKSLFCNMPNETFLVVLHSK